MMSPSDTSPLAPLVAKLRLWRSLDRQDQEALLALPYRLREYRPQEHIVREGDRPQHVCLMVSGFSIRHKVAGNGGRQIFSIHMKGDLADLQNAMLGVADHNLQALTRVEVALIPYESVQEIAFARPAIGRAMWYDTLVDASIFREWTLNVGRRDARTRAAHLLCEFALRLEAAGLGERCDYDLPMTQEQLADAVGLTSVHVNRVLKQLGEERLISRDRRSIVIEDWAELRNAGDFNERYLHHDAMVAEEAGQARGPVRPVNKG
jgi:CRP-like cAMP-binding protein